MSFIQAIIKNPTRSLSMQNKAAGTATTAGLLYDLVSGLLVAATSSSTRATLAGVANQSISVADALTQCPIFDPFTQDVWIADSTNNSNAAHNGQDMILGANAGIVNNTGTTSAVGVVRQVGVYGATGDKKILVTFLATN
jgi:hypothetical protein